MGWRVRAYTKSENTVSSHARSSDVSPAESTIGPLSLDDPLMPQECLFGFWNWYLGFLLPFESLRKLTWTAIA